MEGGGGQRLKLLRLLKPPPDFNRRISFPSSRWNSIISNALLSASHDVARYRPDECFPCCTSCLLGVSAAERGVSSPRTQYDFSYVRDVQAF